MEGASHEILLQRFKLLHLVQQVAKADVEEVIRTVGVDALAYSGRGVSEALAAIGLSSQDPRDAASRRRDPYVDRHEYDRHIFRNFAKPRDPRQQSGSHAHLAAAGHIDTSQEAVDSSLRFRVRNLQEPRVPFSRTQQLMQAREAHHGHTSAAPPLRQQQQEQPRQQQLRLGEPVRRGDLVSTPEKERNTAAALGANFRAQGIAPPPVPPPTSTALDGAGQSIPEAVVYLAAQILAKGGSGGGAGGGRYSKESTPRKTGSTAAPRIRAEMDAEAQAAGAGEAFGMVTERQHRAQTGAAPDGIRTATFLESSTSPIPDTATQRCDECFGTEDRGDLSTENAAVGTTVSYATAETMTPSKKMKATTTQTSNAVAAVKPSDPSAKGSRPSPVTPPKAATASDKRKSATASAPPPTLNLTDKQDHNHLRHRRDPRSTSGVPAPRSHTPPTTPLSDDADDALLPTTSALDALASIDRILSEQHLIEQRSAAVRQSMATRQMVDRQSGEHPNAPVSMDVDAATRELELARAARSVDSMLLQERSMAEAAVEKGQRLEEEEGSRQQQRQPGTAPQRRERKTMPRSVVERLLQFRKDEIACIKYNEQLWNTSSLSQHVFADRLTAALLDDLLSEVVAEVSSVLDDYVEGLAEHELQ